MKPSDEPNTISIQHPFFAAHSWQGLMRFGYGQ